MINPVMDDGGWRLLCPLIAARATRPQQVAYRCRDGDNVVRNDSREHPKEWGGQTRQVKGVDPIAHMPEHWDTGKLGRHAAQDMAF